MDVLRYSPVDPYYRLGAFHTCLYVRACRLVTRTSPLLFSPILSGLSREAQPEKVRNKWGFRESVRMGSG